MDFLHDGERVVGRTQMICTHDDMIRAKDQVEEHIHRYIDSLDKAHINVTIAGGGNAVHVIAAYCGHLENVKTTILKCNKGYQSFKDALAAHDYKMIAKHRDGRPDVEGTVDLITNSPEEAIRTADVVIISIPAYAHEEYFSCISEFLTPGTIVGVMVAEGGTDWLARSCFGDKEDDILFFGLETLPWACRYETYGHIVNVRETKQIVNVAVDPPSKRFEVCAVLQYLIGLFEKEETEPGVPHTHRSIPEYHPVANLLSLTLMNMNAFVHPSIIYCKFMDWDGVSSFPEKPLFYEGVDAKTAATLAAISGEIQAIKHAIGKVCPEVDLSNVITMEEWLRSVYGDPIPDGADMQVSMNCVCKESGRYAGILHVMNEVIDPVTGVVGYVPDTKYRYWTEDVPCGLVVILGVAELFEVDTPMIKTVILWMQDKMGKQYITPEGRVAGAPDLGETKAPQRFGLTRDTVLSRYIH
jgi:hypothetical protein